MTTMKVSERNRDRLADIARRYDKTLDQALGGLLAEHEMLIEARTKQVLADEEFLARVQAARNEPRHETVAHRDVLAMFDSNA